VAKAEKGETPNAWVDDTAFFRVVDNMEQEVQAMTNTMTRTGGALEWSKSHNSLFDVPKFGFMIFTQKREADPVRPEDTRPMKRPDIILDGRAIKASHSVRYLGVMVDEELR
jgi:hypothetical protein